MIKRFLFVSVMIVFFCISSHQLHAGNSVAFGYFVNTSENESFDYLEEVLPNSFSSALKNRYKIDTISPDKLELSYPDEQSPSGKRARLINNKELPTLATSTNADYFIFGTFIPVENNRIKLIISIYEIQSNSIFTFEEIGYLETEIFKLVDRIALQLNNLIDPSMAFKSDVVKSNSKIALLTNIEGPELNNLYYEFLSSGYRVSSLQGNELYTYLSDESIQNFLHVQAKNASYDIVGDLSLIELMHGTWSGKEYYKKIINEREIFRKYCINYLKQVDLVLNQLSKTDSELDYIIIIGFDGSLDTAWYRCIDVKNDTLISIKEGINGNSVNDVAKKIITNMSTPLSIKN